MALLALDGDNLSLVRALQTELGMGDDVTSARWAAMAAWQSRLAAALGIAAEPTNAWEPFALIRDRQDEPPLVGPRWWFHLLGLRHGAAHAVLTTPQGWFVAQRRSRAKDDAPGALDVAVSGHIGVEDPATGIWREMAEEIGLSRTPDGTGPSIVHNLLAPLFVYDVADDARGENNPPVLNRERIWVFGAQLTPAGMARLQFADGEVTALMLLGPDDTRRLAQRCATGEIRVPGELDLALGIRGTLPRWLAERDRQAARKRYLA